MKGVADADKGPVDLCPTERRSQDGVGRCPSEARSARTSEGQDSRAMQYELNFSPETSKHYTTWVSQALRDAFMQYAD